MSLHTGFSPHMSTITYMCSLDCWLQLAMSEVCNIILDTACNPHVGCLLFQCFLLPNLLQICRFSVCIWCRTTLWALSTGTTGWTSTGPPTSCWLHSQMAAPSTPSPRSSSSTGSVAQMRSVSTQASYLPGTWACMHLQCRS